MKRFPAQLILWLFEFCAHLSAGDIHFSQFSDDHGLSHNSVTAILQDHFGFLWFGTIEGLNRFDGYQATVYLTDPQQPNSISDNWVTALAEDQEGRLWIGTRRGLNLLHKDGSIQRLGLEAGLPAEHVTCLLPDGNDVLVGTWGGGLCRWIHKQKRLVAVEADEVTDPPVGANIYTMVPGQEGSFWLGTKTGLAQLTGASLRTFSLPEGAVRSLAFQGDYLLAGRNRDIAECGRKRNEQDRRQEHPCRR